MAKQKKRKTLAEKKAGDPRQKSVKQKRREAEAKRKKAMQKLNNEFEAEMNVSKSQYYRITAQGGVKI